jgi:hypothetical protein
MTDPSVKYLADKRREKAPILHPQGMQPQEGSTVRLGRRT